MPTSLRQPASPAAAPDLAAEIAGLGDADLLRFKALARLRARGLPGVDWADVFDEAVLRLLDGSRARPPGVPLVAVLATAMRGVADDHWRRVRRERPVLVRPSATDRAEERADPAPDPERAAAAAQALAALDRLFARDAVASQIIAGLADGLTASEIRARYGLDETAYDTARRRMRRALLRQEREELGP